MEFVRSAAPRRGGGLDAPTSYLLVRQAGERRSCRMLFNAFQTVARQARGAHRTRTEPPPHGRNTCTGPAQERRKRGARTVLAAAECRKRLRINGLRLWRCP